MYTLTQPQETLLGKWVVHSDDYMGKSSNKTYYFDAEDKAWDFYNVMMERQRVPAA